MRRQDKYRNMEQANLMLENSYLKRKGLLKEDSNSFGLPEDIKNETREYLLDKLRNLQPKLNKPGYLEKEWGNRKNIMYYYGNDGIIYLFDDVDSLNKIYHGESTLVISEDLKIDFEKEKGEEYFKIDGRDIRERFAGYFRELVGEIVTELYNRKFDRVVYGLNSPL